MGLSKKDLFIKEKNLRKFIKSGLDNDKFLLDIEKDLGLAQYKRTENSN